MNATAAGAALPTPSAAVPAEVSPDVSAFDLHDTRVAMALARLEASRAQLRAAMLPPLQEQTASTGFEFPRRWRAMWRAWRRSGPLALVAGTAMGAVHSWWRRQPWHDSTEWAGRAVMAETRPLIRRHPFWAMALGIGAGAALVAARPWRWQAVNRRVRPIGGHLVSWLVGQLSQVPVQVALAALLARFVGEMSREPAAPPTPPPSPSPDARPGPAPGRPEAAASDATVH